jgi:hypothetical protein
VKGTIKQSSCCLFPNEEMEAERGAKMDRVRAESIGREVEGCVATDRSCGRLSCGVKIAITNDANLTVDNSAFPL